MGEALVGRAAAPLAPAASRPVAAVRAGDGESVPPACAVAHRLRAASSVRMLHSASDSAPELRGTPRRRARPGTGPSGGAAGQSDGRQRAPPAPQSGRSTERSQAGRASARDPAQDGGAPPPGRPGPAALSAEQLKTVSAVAKQRWTRLAEALSVCVAKHSLDSATAAVRAASGRRGHKHGARPPASYAAQRRLRCRGTAAWAEALGGPTRPHSSTHTAPGGVPTAAHGLSAWDRAVASAVLGAVGERLLRPLVHGGTEARGQVSLDIRTLRPSFPRQRGGQASPASEAAQAGWPLPAATALPRADHALAGTSALLANASSVASNVTARFVARASDTPGRAAAAASDETTEPQTAQAAAAAQGWRHGWVEDAQLEREDIVSRALGPRLLSIPCAADAVATLNGRPAPAGEADGPRDESPLATMCHALAATAKAADAARELVPLVLADADATYALAMGGSGPSASGSQAHAPDAARAGAMAVPLAADDGPAGSIVVVERTKHCVGSQREAAVAAVSSGRAVLETCRALGLAAANLASVSSGLAALFDCAAADQARLGVALGEAIEAVARAALAASAELASRRQDLPCSRLSGPVAQLAMSEGALRTALLALRAQARATPGGLESAALDAAGGETALSAINRLREDSADVLMAVLSRFAQPDAVGREAMRPSDLMATLRAAQALAVRPPATLLDGLATTIAARSADLSFREVPIVLSTMSVLGIRSDAAAMSLVANLQASAFREERWGGGEPGDDFGPSLADDGDDVLTALLRGEADEAEGGLASLDSMLSQEAGNAAGAGGSATAFGDGTSADAAGRSWGDDRIDNLTGIDAATPGSVLSMQDPRHLATILGCLVSLGLDASRPAAAAAASLLSSLDDAIAALPTALPSGSTAFAPSGELGQATYATQEWSAAVLDALTGPSGRQLWAGGEGGQGLVSAPPLAQAAPLLGVVSLVRAARDAAADRPDSPAAQLLADALHASARDVPAVGVGGVVPPCDVDRAVGGLIDAVSAASLSGVAQAWGAQALHMEVAEDEDRARGSASDEKRAGPVSDSAGADTCAATGWWHGLGAGSAAGDDAWSGERVPDVLRLVGLVGPSATALHRARFSALCSSFTGRGVNAAMAHSWAAERLAPLVAEASAAGQRATGGVEDAVEAAAAAHAAALEMLAAAAAEGGAAGLLEDLSPADGSPLAGAGSLQCDRFSAPPLGPVVDGGGRVVVDLGDSVHRRGLVLLHPALTTEPGGALGEERTCGGAAAPLLRLQAGVAGATIAADDYGEPPSLWGASAWPQLPSILAASASCSDLQGPADRSPLPALHPAAQAQFRLQLLAALGWRVTAVPLAEFATVAVIPRRECLQAAAEVEARSVAAAHAAGVPLDHWSVGQSCQSAKVAAFGRIMDRTPATEAELAFAGAALWAAGLLRV